MNQGVGAKINENVSSNQTKIDTKQLRYACYRCSIEFDHFPIKTGQLIIAN
jgi:hypothetical protein